MRFTSDYDGGDCCECTCVSTDVFTCGDENHGGFACVDPSAPCVNDDDFTPGADDFYFDYDDDFSASFEFQPCIDDFISDGDCDSANNNEECGGSKLYCCTMIEPPRSVGGPSFCIQCFPVPAGMKYDRGLSSAYYVTCMAFRLLFVVLLIRSTMDACYDRGAPCFC